MTKRIGRLLGLTLALCLLASCSGHKSSDFIAEGTISGAADQMLYLEETISEEPRIIDSVRLDKEGHFSFRGEGHSYPMLYRLRLGEQHIPFAADSARRFSITAEASRLFDSYRITSPEDYNKQIQEVCRLSKATSSSPSASSTPTPRAPRPALRCCRPSGRAVTSPHAIQTMPQPSPP